jgi:hypothetical protein
VGAFTTKTAKKDGAGVLSPPKPREKTGPAVSHHHFRCVCARHHQMWVFLCRHQKREFFVITKTERNLRSPPNPGIVPKASDIHLFGDEVPSQKKSLKTSSFLTLANQHRFQRLIDRIGRLKEHLTWQQSAHRPVIMARSYAGWIIFGKLVRGLISKQMYWACHHQNRNSPY